MQLHILSHTQVGLSLKSSFGASQATAFRDLIRTALSRSPREIILDCGKLNYIDSTGLGLLVLAQNEAVKLGGKVLLANVTSDHVKNLLSIMQYDRLFPVITYAMPKEGTPV